jgi:nicotinamidase-related amidase
VGVRGLDAGEPAALIINECQRGIIDPAFVGTDGLGGEVARRDVVARIARLASTCRAAGVTVVHSTIVMRPDGIGTVASCLLLGALVKAGTVVAGRPEAEIVPELAPGPGDLVSQRAHGLSPFHGTELESFLRERRVETVIVTGVSTNVGVPGACLEAINRGFRAVVPEDATAGAWAEAHQWMVRHHLPLLGTVTSVDAVEQDLSARTT